MKTITQLLLITTCALALSACKSTSASKSGSAANASVAPAAPPPLGYWAFDGSQIDAAIATVGGEEEDRTFMKEMMEGMLEEMTASMTMHIKENEILAFRGSKSQPMPAKILKDEKGNFTVEITGPKGEADTGEITMSDADHMILGGPGGKGMPMPLKRIDEATFKARTTATE